MRKLEIPSDSLRHLDGVFDFAKGTPIEDVLAQIVELVQEAVPTAHHASITLRPDRSVKPVFSDDIARSLGEGQLDEKSGPCVDALDEGEAVVSRDLTSESRWPRFTADATEQGVKATACFPMTTVAGPVGVLSLYSDQSESFVDEDLTVAGLIASRAGIGLANKELFLQAKELEDQLRDALSSRDVIGQAKGIVMAGEGCTDDEAFKMLVTASQHSNRKLRDVAQAIVDEHNTHIQKKN